MHEIPVDAEGVVQPEALRTVTAANNESGLLQPWLALAEMCRVHQVRFHSDASQWLVKVDATSPAHFDFQQMKAAFPELSIISGNAPRLWNTVLMVMPEHSNLKWLTRLSRLGFAISTGSACSTGKEGSSVVVNALGASWEELRGVVRISGGWQTSPADWQHLSEAFKQVSQDLDIRP